MRTSLAVFLTLLFLGPSGALFALASPSPRLDTPLDRLPSAEATTTPAVLFVVSPDAAHWLSGTCEVLPNVPEDGVATVKLAAKGEAPCLLVIEEVTTSDGISL